MRVAIAQAETRRTRTFPNPWVGAALICASPGMRASLGQQPSEIVGGATSTPPGLHAEINALAAALEHGFDTQGATLCVTLEPCSHHGRTPPCVDAIIAAEISKVIIGVTDPDERVNGAGVEVLRDAGIEVVVGCLETEVERQLQPYLHQRRTGRPLVVAKWAQSLDGKIAAADSSSTWITSELARADVARLRAECEAICVGARTVRADNPHLTVRLCGDDAAMPVAQPLRVVLGDVEPGSNVEPCLCWKGSLDELLIELGSRGVTQLLVEGGGGVLHGFVSAGLVDRYVVYVAAALSGASGGVHVFEGGNFATMAQMLRLNMTSVTRLGPDLRIDLDIHGVAG